MSHYFVSFEFLYLYSTLVWLILDWVFLLHSIINNALHLLDFISISIFWNILKYKYIKAYLLRSINRLKKIWIFIFLISNNKNIWCEIESKSWMYNYFTFSFSLISVSKSLFWKTKKLFNLFCRFDLEYKNYEIYYYNSFMFW